MHERLLPPRPTVATLEALCRERAPASYAARLTGLRLPVFRFPRTLAPDDGLPIGASKLGGAPDLPADAAWPVGQTAPHAFMGQVDLGTLQPLEGPHDLPASGLLSFFYDAETQPGINHGNFDRAGAVLFTPATEKLTRHVPPGSPFRSASLEVDATWSLPIDAPWLLPMGFEDQDVEDADAMRSLAYELSGDSGRLYGPLAPTIQLLGYAKAPQSPMEESLGGSPDDWRLLAQFASDEDVFGDHWADLGSIFYWIRKDHLREGRFDEVFVMGQW